MDRIFVSVGGLGLLFLIYWYFFGKTEEGFVVSGETEVVVDGGYKPSVLRLKKGVLTTLKITRKDPNSCLEEIILPDFKIKKFLPVGETVNIEIKPDKSGEFPFHCGMNMYHGKVIVE